MAVTAVGFTGTVNEAQFASMMRLAMLSNWDEIVDTGALTPAVATGTRLVSVAAGSAMGAGVMVTNSASLNVTLPANGSANPRIDYIVVQINWSTDTATITSVQGATSPNPVPPNLTRTAGTLWQIPLAKVRVNASVTQLGAGTVEDVRPNRRRAFEYSVSIANQNIGTGANDVTVDTIDIPDPGWPFMVYCSTRFSMTNIASGHMNAEILVDGVSLGTGSAPAGNIGDLVIPGRASGQLNESVTVRLAATSASMSATSTITGGRLNVLLVPA